MPYVTVCICVVCKLHEHLNLHTHKKKLSPLILILHEYVCMEAVLIIFHMEMVGKY